MSITAFFTILAALFLVQNAAATCCLCTDCSQPGAPERVTDVNMGSYKLTCAQLDTQMQSTLDFTKNYGECQRRRELFSAPCGCGGITVGTASITTKSTKGMKMKGGMKGRNLKGMKNKGKSSEPYNSVWETMNSDSGSVAAISVKSPEQVALEQAALEQTGTTATSTNASTGKAMKGKGGMKRRNLRKNTN